MKTHTTDTAMALFGVACVLAMVLGVCLVKAVLR